jgi:cobyrinic acid a,c-diamide synthase
MAALACRGRRVASAKVGPDFVHGNRHLTAGSPGPLTGRMALKEETLARLNLPALRDTICR